MNLVSWNGLNINDTTNYRALIPEDAPLMAQSKEVAYKREDAWPVFAGKELDGIRLPIVISIRGGSLDALQAAFNTEQQDLHQLIASDGSENYYLEATPTLVIAESPVTVRVILYVPDPVWRSSTEYSETWTITASGQTKAISNSSRIDIFPKFEITPTSVKTGGGGYRRWVPIYNQNNEIFTKYPINIADNGTGTGVLDTAALVTAGKMQSDGSDLVVKVDGNFVDRYIYGINTSATKVWINLSLQPGIEFTLLSAILSGDTVTELQAEKTVENTSAMEKLPRRGVVLIDNEAFTYTDVNPNKRKLLGVMRAKKDTTAAGHSAGTTVRWIEHDVWMLYGDTSIWKPTNDTSKQPIFSLNSTNLIWTYASFDDADTKRTGEWAGNVASSRWGSSRIYTGVRGAVADPSTEMGMSIIAYFNGLKYKTEEAKLEWQLNHPAGIVKVTASGEKRRVLTNWPTVELKYLHPTRQTWEGVWIQATPSTANTWESWTETDKTISPTAKSIKFKMEGLVSGGATANQANFSIKDAIIYLDSTGIPVTKLNAELGEYYLNARITNNTSGEWIDLNWNMKVNTMLKVNCEDRTIVYDSMINALAARTLSTVRKDWLNLAPGSNTLQFDDTGTTGVTILVKYRKRKL